MEKRFTRYFDTSSEAWEYSNTVNARDAAIVAGYPSLKPTKKGYSVEVLYTDCPKVVDFGHHVRAPLDPICLGCQKRLA